MAIMGDVVNTNPRITAADPFGYSSYKPAFNMFTTLLAKELRRTAIQVNSADPGLNQTNIAGSEAKYTIAEGAKPAVWPACLDEYGPTGGFFSHEPVNL